MKNSKVKQFTLIIFSGFFLLTKNAYSMPSFSDIITAPFKAVAKPFVWWSYGYENKVDEYKVAITYNLEFDGKPLTITKAINCEIYEGQFRPDSDGIKRPTRRAVRSVSQLTHKIEETGEILILPIPGYCEVDKPFNEEKTIDKNGKTGIKIIPIANKTKSFSRLSDKVIQSFAIVKFYKENPNQIDRIERVISPKYYELANARIKLKSYNFTTDTNLEVVDPQEENRFSWINGEAKTDKLPRWGTYKDEDKGVYAAFGMFKYKKEIWSKIPTLNEFILKVIKEQKNQDDIIYLSYDDKKYQELGIKKALEDAKYYLADLQSYHSIDRYFGSRGIAGDTERSLLAKTIADSNGIMIKNPKADIGKGWVVKEGKEKDFQKIYEISNYRDYYYPFIFSKGDQIWKEDELNKGLLIIQKINNGKNFNSDIVGDYKNADIYKIKNKKYDKKTEFMLYDIKNEELTIVPHGHGIRLK